MTNILDKAMDLFSSFERRGEPLAPRWLFARRLVINIGLALALILVSLVGGMAGYHYIEGSGWLDAFDQTAMILGGMGPPTASPRPMVASSSPVSTRSIRGSC